MDLDYHYATIYVLSRWAKFGSANSHLIATSSQLVDDNYDQNPFSDKEEKENIANGVRVRYSCQNVWGNMTGKGNCEVWVPFHFLPGLEGEDNDEKLVCKKNSELAEKLAERLLDTDLDNSDFPFKLGVGLHVYADTWAHQEFAGINAALNKVQSLLFANQGSVIEKAIGELIGANTALNKMVEMTNPLGHVAAVHCPDMPFLWWRSGDHFKEGRKNWDEFMEASEKIFRILQSVSCEPVTGLSERQQELLVQCFKGIQSDDIDVRYKEWIKRIHDNFFEIEDFNEEDAEVEYSPGVIMGDLNFRTQFYEEINNHFDWVRDELLEAGIDVLKEEAIF